MTIIGSDRSGPRVQCSVYKESGACENGARYYIEKIERLVIDALRIQLANPDLIKECVKAYREERNRTASAARRQRTNLERDHAKAKSEIQRVVGAIAKGIINDSEAAASLSPLRATLARLETELANAESHTNVIELHPQAVQRFKENIEDLASILTSRDETPDLALFGSFQSLVEGVIVQPRKAGQEYEVRIRGHLAALMGPFRRHGLRFIPKT
jgi:site-specific DNA recombinase